MSTDGDEDDNDRLPMFRYDKFSTLRTNASVPSFFVERGRGKGTESHNSNLIVAMNAPLRAIN